VELLMSPHGLHRRIGQLVVVGFSGTTLPVELRSLAKEFDLGGVILFSRNVESAEQVAGLAHEVQQLPTEWPGWVSVDQEGGRVARLKAPFTEWPPMAALGNAGDELLAERYGRALARELRSVGISWDFAPVLDVLTNPRNTVIGDRALSSDPATVSTLGAAIVKGLQETGVAACAKHFPGHGDTISDSHVELPIVEHPQERLRSTEWPPFRSATDAGVASVMMGHLLVPALDETRPASLSRGVVTGVLREEFAYQGLVVTDDLEMGACKAYAGMEESSIAALEAGCDVILLCGTDQEKQAAVLEALTRAVEQDRLRYGGIEDALSRQRRAKERFLLTSGVVKRSSYSVSDAALPGRGRDFRPPSTRLLDQILGCEEHRAIAAEIARFL
jgi:beta-N-acetylhexosaminidase